MSAKSSPARHLSTERWFSLGSIDLYGRWQAVSALANVDSRYRLLRIARIALARMAGPRGYFIDFSLCFALLMSVNGNGHGDFNADCNDGQCGRSAGGENEMKSVLNHLSPAIARTKH